MSQIEFTATAGLMVRGSLRREIQEYCFLHGLFCNIQEDKGLFQSLYKFTVAGPERDINDLISILKEIERSGKL